jgi:hypothetical protein
VAVAPTWEEGRKERLRETEVRKEERERGRGERGSEGETFTPVS